MQPMQQQHQHKPVEESPFDYDPWKIIHLNYCNVRFYGQGHVRTVFISDGSHFEGWPHATDHYREITARCGYGHYIFGEDPNVNQYCQEHDFCHNFLAERIKRQVSTVIWPMAHNAPVPKYEGLCEEALVQIFQRWLHTDERPILDVANWDSLKVEALDLLAPKF